MNTSEPPQILWRAFFCLSITLLCLSAWPLTTSAKEKPIVLSIGFSDGDPPTSWANDSVTARGLLPELAAAVFKRINDIHIDAHPYPWPRVKLMAEKGELDSMFTYPSDSRKAFMLFSDEPAYVIDYGYIIFHRENPKAEQLATISDYTQLANFLMVTEGPETDDSWEEENLALDTFPRIYVNKAVQMFHLLFRRQSADYFIRNLEEARYIANTLGYGDKFAYTKVNFATQNVIPFHLGVHKSHPFAEYIIEQINKVQSTPEFKKEAREIIERYQHLEM